jgi:hypothetical protein
VNRAFLRWFYVGVQFIMLAVSIPKVAMLFHAYDKETMGPLLAGVDARSWLVGIAIDLTATFTTWAAMAKYDESRKRSALFAPAVIILFCSALSVVANYEDAATQNPAQYAQISLFTHPALLINPVLISAPPVLALLLILLVPSVLAQPRIRTAAEIEAEASEAEARIAAGARVREAKVKANAQVRGTRLKGWAETVSAVTSKADAVEDVYPLYTNANDVKDSGDTYTSSATTQPSAKLTRAVWQALKLPERVTQSGVMTAQEIADVLGISVAYARNLMKEVESETPTVHGRRGVSYNDLIDALYNRRRKDSYGWARKLESTLGVRKRSRPIHVVTIDEVTEEEVASGGDGD